MGWRDELAVGDFVVVDRFDSWTVEMVTRRSRSNIWTSRRGGGEDRFTSAWGRPVGASSGALVEWTPSAEALLKERDAEQRASAEEAARREEHWRKSQRILRIDWRKVPDETLDAVLRLAGEEP